MQDTPLVSIVLPTYNGSAYLDQAVQSCLAQTYPHWELIIVDDASTDDTPQQVAAYQARDRRIRPVRHQTNRKLPGALNTGFALARGSYLAWLSDDNCYRPEALGEMVHFLERNSAIGLVYTDYTEIDEQGRPCRRRTARQPEELAFFNSVGPSFLYRRAVQTEVGEYAEDLFLAEDYDFWLRVSTAFRLAPLHKDLYLYRRHSRSLTHVEAERIRLAADRALSRALPQMTWLAETTRAQAYWRLALRAWERRQARQAAVYVYQTARYSVLSMIHREWRHRDAGRTRCAD